MSPRIPATLALAALVTVLATGCGPATSATPTPTPSFTSEAQAYAAAERTYRAYVDALNHVDLADPRTFEAVYRWTTGEALNGEKKSLTKMHADGWTVSGATKFESSWATTDPTTAPFEKLETVVCIDVSKVRVVDKEHRSQVSPHRPNRNALRVQYHQTADSPASYKIAKSTAVEDRRCSQ